MLYRVDALTENKINLITGIEYDTSWAVLMLTDSTAYRHFVDSKDGCVYTIKVSKMQCQEWRMSVGDFISFNKANGKNMILFISEADLADVMRCYEGHRFNEPGLRDYEPRVLVHSTTLENWEQIQQDGMLKSWNRLKQENLIGDAQPIGAKLGDPEEFSDYIMFGGGVTCEIVVNSKQCGNIVMDVNTEYFTGARLYFDFQQIARDGLLVRDGTHLKVKDTLSLEPHLIWATTWESVGLISRTSTPKEFAEKADEKFALI